MGKTKLGAFETIQIQSAFEPIEPKEALWHKVEKPVDKPTIKGRGTQLFPPANVKTHVSTGFPQALQQAMHSPVLHDGSFRQQEGVNTWHLRYPAPEGDWPPNFVQHPLLNRRG